VRRAEPDAGKWHLYVIRCGDDSLYTGIATDVERRLSEHREGGARGARYLRGRAPLELVYRLPVGSRSRALQLERRLKGLTKEEKERVVRAGPDADELSRRLGLGEEEE
jgi:putative endonuclease